MYQSRRSIECLAEQVELIWRRSRPELVRLYDKMDRVKARSTEAAHHLRTTTQNLQRMGLTFDQANNLAMYEWVYLPDIDEDDEALIQAGTH